ncbi:MAG: hypothetical protein AB1Z65_12585 [Candidatus Sulfomarinibacteraceae bacterium]
MAQRFVPVLKALNDAGVRYLVVGGVAVVLHGHLRTTGDLVLKRAAGRAQDIEDVAFFESIVDEADDG